MPAGIGATRTYGWTFWSLLTVNVRLRVCVCVCMYLCVSPWLFCVNCRSQSSQPLDCRSSLLRKTAAQHCLVPYRTCPFFLVSLSFFLVVVVAAIMPQRRPLTVTLTFAAVFCCCVCGLCREARGRSPRSQRRGGECVHGGGERRRGKGKRASSLIVSVTKA